MQPLFKTFNIIFIVTTLSISWLLKKYYPKEINDFIGYRTKRSMSSQEQWLFANEYCSRLLFKMAIATCTFQIVIYALVNAKIAVLTSVVLWMTCLIVAIIVTEIKLKNKF